MRIARWAMALNFVVFCGGYPLAALCLLVVWAASFVGLPKQRRRTGRGLGPPPGWRPEPRPPLSLSGSSALIIREL